MGLVMKQFPPRFFRAAALLVLLQAGCPSNQFFPAATPPGKQGSADQENGQCRIIEDWYARYTKEVSQPGSPLNSRRTMMAGANLLRSSFFAPVFGVPYRSQYATNIHDKYITSVTPCYKDSRFSASLVPAKPFLDMALETFNADLSQTAEALDVRELWMERSLKEMDAVSETIQGLERLQAYGRESQELLLPLWPSERESFKSILETKQKLVAGRLLAQLDPASMAPSAYSLRTLSRLSPYLGGAGEGDANAVRQRFQAMMGEMMTQKRNEVEKIPLTLEGREISRNWFEDFDRDYGDLNFNTQVVQVLQAWMKRRESIYEKTKPDFVSHVRHIKGDENRAEKYRALLEETFPLPSDKKMLVYDSYKQEILDHQKSVMQKLADKGKTTFQQIHRSLSDLAKFLVHGSDK